MIENYSNNQESDYNKIKKKILIIITKIVIVIIREIVREAIVEIEVPLTTTQGKRGNSSTTLRNKQQHQ